MIRQISFLIFISGVVAFSQDEGTEVKYYHLLYNMDKHFFNSFTDHYGLYHLTAIAGSYAMVESGFDWEVHEFSRKNQWIPRTGFLSVRAGHYVPMIVPAGLFLYGTIWEDNDVLVSSLALGQSIMLSYVIVSSLKAITGRKGPDIRGEENNPVPDYSRDFKWGFFERGVFDGWPSGHTTTAFAMAFTMAELFPENTTLAALSIAYASLIGIGISVNIHWFSDFFAGALIGYTIGKSVGKGFRKLLGNAEEDDSNFSLSVLPGFISIQYNF